MTDSLASKSTTVLYAVQATYYGLTGLWPLIHIDSFKAVTGEKTDNLPTGLDADHWLVMTVGVLVTAIALGLATAAIRRTHSVEMVVVAIGAAVGLTGIDVVYVLRNVIQPIYLVDAVLQVLLIAAWGLVLFRQREQNSEDPR